MDLGIVRRLIPYGQQHNKELAPEGERGMQNHGKLTKAVETITPAPKYRANKYTYSGKRSRGDHFARIGKIVAAEETIRRTNIDEILAPICPLYSLPDSARAHTMSRGSAVVKSTFSGLKTDAMVSDNAKGQDRQKQTPREETLGMGRKCYAHTHTQRRAASSNDRPLCNKYVLTWPALYISYATSQPSRIEDKHEN